MQDTLRQTRTWQNRILAKAKADGYRDLYWLITMYWDAGRREAPAAYPGRYVPVVPVGPCPTGSRRIAGMLEHFFRMANPATITFDTILISADVLDSAGCHWYRWDTDVVQDAICPACGAVTQVGHTWLDGESWLYVCGQCGNDANRRPG